MASCDPQGQGRDSGISKTVHISNETPI